VAFDRRIFDRRIFDRRTKESIMSTPPKFVRLARAVPFLLACLLVGSACGVRTAASSTPTRALPTTTLLAKPPTPTRSPAPQWVTHTVTLEAGATPRSYKIDMPGALDRGMGSGPEGHTEVSFHYGGDYPADHPVVSEMYIYIDASVVTDSTVTCRTGAKITVGPGITGYQADSTNDTCDGTPPPAVRAFWIASGVCYLMRVAGMYSGPQDFNTRYGAIWQHILASFVPSAPPAAGDTTCS
jgi:hypothetical protein